MKGLLNYLAPFAPDQSGAASVLFELGGITVICDAGGCTGNICGFDEPRWFEKKSAVFSAGLRDMDAIMGRDDRLVEKLADAAGKLNAAFIALIGTPVPAVIATDYQALARLAEKKCGLPVITAECTGTRLYDAGEEEMYETLFRRFAERETERDASAVGVIGMTPLDISCTHGDIDLKRKLKEEGWQRVYCYGMGGGLDEVRKAGSAAKNLVVSPAGVRAAEYLKRTFGTPWEMCYPFLTDEFRARLHSLAGKRVLIVHQQAAANEIRREILSASAEEKNMPVCSPPALSDRNALDAGPPDGESCGAEDAGICAAGFFLQKKLWMRPQDLHFNEEHELADAVREGGYDAVIGDGAFRRVLTGFGGEFIEIPHFAVSGELTSS